MDDLLKNFEPRGFVKEYLAYATRLTDAPPAFHVFTALTILGAAASRVRLPYGAAMLPPALWTVLAAPGAFFRKTTAMDLGRRLLARARPEAVAPPVYGGEGLLGSLRAEDRLLGVDDFRWLLATPARDRLIAKSDRASRFSVLAAACTSDAPAWLSPAELASGYLARFGFVLAEHKGFWLGLPGVPDEAAEKSLTEFLSRAARLRGTARLRQAYPGLRSWVEKTTEWMNGMAANIGHFRMACGLAARLEPLVLKLAVLLEISASGSLVVSPASFAGAWRLSRCLALSFGRLFMREWPRANRFQQELRLMGMLRRMPGITRRRLQQNSHMDAATFAQALSALEKSGQMRRNGHRLHPVTGRGKARLLAVPGANSQALENTVISA